MSIYRKIYNKDFNSKNIHNSTGVTKKKVFNTEVECILYGGTDYVVTLKHVSERGG